MILMRQSTMASPSPVTLADVCCVLVDVICELAVCGGEGRSGCP